MSRTGKLLAVLAVGLLLVLGAAQTDAADFLQDRALELSLVAVLLVLAYEGAVAVVAGVTAGPIARRASQLSTALDQAIGRRLSRYARQYRDHMRTRQRFVDSRGLATVGDHVPELDRVFVDVGLAPRPPHQVPAGVLADVPPDTAPDVPQRRTIHEFLHHPEPVVLAVLGGPGSGKTTLLRHVARQAVSPGPGQRRRIPILLTLRDHAGRIAADPELSLPQLVRASLPELPVREPEGWWDDQLHHGRCVVLLDGLDEVARAGDRRTVADWIERQITTYPRNDVVVTSRPHGYRAAVLGPATVLQVRPFTDEQVRRFLHGWYLATERHATGADGPDIAQRAAERADDLLDRLASAPALYELAVNPLLLTMIALVHRYRSALPAGRADLYSEICQVMLWRRQEAKRLPVDLPGSGKERVLAHLAFTMMSQRVRDLPRPVVLETILPSLRRIATETRAEAFLADVESNGLLVERERGLYAFAHHTIGEYLAARHIRDHGLIQVLADAVGDTWWRETTLLYVADADADPVVQACLADGSIAALALAFDCAYSGGALAPELRARLDGIHHAAFAPDADPERRRLVASVLATRHLSRLVATPDGARLCPHPVPSDLYWLFCQDTGHPVPDGTAGSGPDPDRPVLGAWYRDAQAFASWVNTVLAGPGGDRSAQYRLPALAELPQPAGAPDGADLPPDPDGADPPAEPDGADPPAGPDGVHRAGVWTRPDRPGEPPRRWYAQPPEADPDRVSTAELRAATTADTVRSPVLLELLLVSASTLDQAIDLDPGTLPAPERGRGQALPVAIARDLDVAHTLTHYHDFQLGREHALALAEALGFAGTFDPVRARDHARDHAHHPAAAEPDRAPLADHLPARAQIPGPDVARALVDALGLEFAHTPSAEQLPELAAGLRRELRTARAGGEPPRPVDLVRTLVMGYGLAWALAAVHERREPKHRRTSIQPLAEAFAGTLVRRAGFRPGEPAPVALAELPETLRRSCAGFTGDREPPAGWAASVAGRLAGAAGPVFARQRALAPGEPVILRIPALALAAEAERRGRLAAAAGFRTVATGVTLLQRRAEDPAALETVLLARA